MVSKKGGVSAQKRFAYNAFFVQELKYAFPPVDQSRVEYVERGGKSSHQMCATGGRDIRCRNRQLCGAVCMHVRRSRYESRRKKRDLCGKRQRC
jgi:hypothetical protein